MSIQSSPDGKSASAASDKEWIYDGNSRFSGKVNQRLGLQKIDGRWLIVAEKDAKVLYLNR